MCPLLRDFNFKCNRLVKVLLLRFQPDRKTRKRSPFHSRPRAPATFTALNGIVRQTVPRLRSEKKLRRRLLLPI